MAKSFNGSSQLTSSISNSIHRTAKPSSEFYSSFSKEEILGIIHALEVKKEIPLKYSYKGKGAKAWNEFYLKFIISNWYRRSSLEVDLLRNNFEYINSRLPSKKVNIIDIGSGNSYPVKEFTCRLNGLGKVNKYIALDISEELLSLSKNNFTKWFPIIQFDSYVIDIENSSLPKLLLNENKLEADNITKIIFHLGVTIGNHQNRIAVFKNLRDSMDKDDLLVFTNEIGSNSQWDGKVRGGLKYHVEKIYTWTRSKIGIRAEDCELVRKYDAETDSIVANMKLRCSHTINFSFMEIDKNIEISKDEEITIWRHHKHEIPELLQEVKQAGLELVHYSTNKYLSHIMAICAVAKHTHLQ